LVAFAANSKLVAPCAIVTSNEPKTCRVKKRFMQMMKHWMGQRCDVKLLGSASGSRACFGGLAETPFGPTALMSLRDRGS
jgi:hypothetical protein